MRTLRVPGDKSITHRALILAALARGESRIRGGLASLDTAATAAALRALGASVSGMDDGVARVTGTGRFAAANGPLDCRNAGTTARLLCGALAAHSFATVITGDASLRRRPMRRVVEPLAAMGASFPGGSETLPLTVHGGALRPVSWTLPIASAQVKSAILLAAAAAGVEATVHEPLPTRDHTERMLRALGCAVTSEGAMVQFTPDGPLPPLELDVPGDISSAAFLAGAAALGGSEPVRIERVGLNPTRTGFLAVLTRMGGSWTTESRTGFGGEPAGDLLVGSAPLQSTIVEAAEIPGLIDEVPLLAVLASRAAGTTVFRGAGELRYKESDRLALIADNLRRVGVTAEASGDELHVSGSDVPPRGFVRTGGDHRIAMAFAVLGSVPGALIELDDAECAAVSYPGFTAALGAMTRQRAS